MQWIVKLMIGTATIFSTYYNDTWTWSFFKECKEPPQVDTPEVRATWAEDLRLQFTFQEDQATQVAERVGGVLQNTVNIFFKDATEDEHDQMDVKFGHWPIAGSLIRLPATSKRASEEQKRRKIVAEPSMTWPDEPAPTESTTSTTTSTSSSCSLLQPVVQQSSHSATQSSSSSTSCFTSPPTSTSALSSTPTTPLVVVSVSVGSPTATSTVIRNNPNFGPHINIITGFAHSDTPFAITDNTMFTCHDFGALFNCFDDVEPASEYFNDNTDDRADRDQRSASTAQPSTSTRPSHGVGK
ncbi:MAG TPA: hypothetical protein V6C97_01150, partial [Oculatellaceae cyanobacterium]